MALFLGKDDWTILACMALLVPVNSFVELMTNNGLGTDNFTLSPRQITLFLKVSKGSSTVTLPRTVERRRSSADSVLLHSVLLRLYHPLYRPRHAHQSLDPATLSANLE